MLDITCSSCGERVQGEDSLRGKRVYCPACKASITLAQTTQDSPATAIAEPDHVAQAKVTLPKSAHDDAFREGPPPEFEAHVRSIPAWRFPALSPTCPGMNAGWRCA